MSVAATSASASGPATFKTIHVQFKNWALSGTVTPKKLNEPITLPEGSTFNGEAAVNLSNFAGPVTGNVFVPPFNSTMKLLGIPGTQAETVGLTLTQAGALEGAFAPVPFFEWKTACPTNSVQGSICVTLSANVKVNMAITAVGALGIDVLPTNCETTEPIALHLVDTLTVKETFQFGPHFTGTTTFPPIVCHGLEAAVLEPVLNALVSGPENPYALAMTKPAA